MIKPFKILQVDYSDLIFCVLNVIPIEDGFLHKTIFHSVTCNVNILFCIGVSVNISFTQDYTYT